ncbi:MAG: cobalamin B12-binding domain-containing protein [Alkalilacustris sp.]
MPPIPLTRASPHMVDDTPPADDRADGLARDGTRPPAATVHERVLNTVAARICRAEGGRDAGPVPCLDMLCDAVVTSDSAFAAALARLRSQHGLRDEDIVDCYIPAAACQLGTDWSENRRSFAEVTIGTARLIAAVRDIGRSWTADGVADVRAANMALVVPEAEQHRLGAMIAATRFRRLGVSVQMLLGCPDADVIASIRDGGFALVCFSLATRDRVEQTRHLIQMLRRDVEDLPPIVVGGAVGVNADELKAQLGADHVVSDPEEALRRCGVTVQKPPGPGHQAKA